MSKFFPTTAVNGVTPEQVSLEQVRREFRFAAKQVMQTSEGEAVIDHYKCNGEITGHKVLDDGEFARQLMAVAPEGLAPMLATNRLTLWQKSQMLNGLLRREWAFDKRNKILRDESGNMVSRLQLTHQASQPE